MKTIELDDEEIKLLSIAIDNQICRYSDDAKFKSLHKDTAVLERKMEVLSNLLMEIGKL